MLKLLVVRFSSIGDIVLTTPVVRALKQQLQAEVHYLTKESFTSILESNPNIDRVITIRQHIREVIGQLKANQYDYIIDLHHNLRSWQVKRYLGVRSVSFPKLNIQKWLLVKFRINRLPPFHIVDRYFMAVQTLNVRNDGKGLDYFIPPADEVRLSDLPVSHRNGYVAITAGAKFATKQLPIDKLIAIIKRMNQPVVVLGGSEDINRAESLEKACGNLIFNACGRYNLNQSASLIRQASWVIAHDTGLMHIAAAFKKKIYSVWGNTVPELGMTPYLPGEGSKIIEVKNLSCRPCSKIGFSKCPKDHFRCMNDIPVEAFLEFI
jgi:ADP-heptose:LPS heptosyltransferase